MGGMCVCVCQKHILCYRIQGYISFPGGIKGEKPKVDGGDLRQKMGNKVRMIRGVLVQDANKLTSKGAMNHGERDV